MTRRLLVIATLIAGIAVAQEYAQEKEAAIGKQMFQELARQWAVVETPAYITDLVNKLAAQSATPVAVETKVIESGTPLANSLPGGIVYISTAILGSATQEELANILAHEIAHASIGRLKMPAGFGTIPLVYMPSSQGTCVRIAESTLLPKSMEARTISIEADADALAAQYLQKAGYQVTGMKTIIARLQSVNAPARKVPTLGPR